MHDFIDQRKIARALYLKYFNISVDYVNQNYQSWVPKPARRRKRKKTKGIKNLSFNITKRQNHPFIPHIVVPVVASAKGGIGLRLENRCLDLQWRPF